jgi:zeaxanthin glucosyltransferase
MAGARIVFLIYHGKGHFNACFKLAKILQQKQYHVTFAGFTYFKNHVTQQGFNFYALQTVPFGLGFERWVNTIEKKEKNIYWRVVRDRWADRLYHLRESELTSMMKAINPDFVLIDAWQSTDLIVLYPTLKSRSVKVGFVQTMLSTIVNRKLPPLTSAALPDHVSGTKKAISNYFRSRFKKKLIDKFKYLGMDNDAMINRRLKLNHLHPKYISNNISIFSRAFNNIDEFILAPREFEFEGTQSLSHQHYIGWMADESRVEVATEDYFKSEKEILDKLATHHLVYCSFGSTSLEQIEVIKTFMARLANVASQKKYFLIVSCTNPQILDLKANYPNLYFFQSVPQLKVLQLTTLFITHGGLNSIKEAIRAEVPMLVYPVTSDTDTNGNSSRILYHQLGLRGDIIHDTESDIEQKITTLITNPVYKANLKKFKLTGKSGEEEFLKLFRELRSID